MSRAVRVVGLLLVCLLAIAGCSTLADLQKLGSEVESAGYDNVNVNHNITNGHSLLVIKATRDGTISSADAEKVAEIAWTKYPGDFDELQVVLNGELKLTAGPDELKSRFGERPAELAESSSGGVNIVAIVGILLCGAVVAVILVVVWRRSNRPPPRPNQQYPQAYPPQYQQPYQQQYQPQFQPQFQPPAQPQYPPQNPPPAQQ